MFDSIHVMLFINMADTASIEYKRQLFLKQFDGLKTSQNNNV